MSYQVTARNFSEAHENKMHSDDVAQQLGFEGALVPGVGVFGHLTHPIAERFGERWLAHSENSTRFFKPAYHDDALSVSLDEVGDTFVTTCTNAKGVVLAELKTRFPTNLGDPEDQDLLNPPVRSEPRSEISWDTIVENQPFKPWTIQLDATENRRHCDQINDALPLYENVVHPHWLLSIANGALTSEYSMPAWIHVGSEIRCRELVNVGDDIAIRAVPLEKWRKKGHEFIRLYVAYYRGDTVTTEVHHTAIYRVAGV